MLNNACSARAGMLPRCFNQHMKTPQILRIASMLIACAFGRLLADAPPPAQPAADETAQAAEQLEIPGINLTHGPATVKLGSVAELKLPEGYAFVGPDSLDRFYEMTQNMRSGQEVGVVISPERWLLFFDYDPVGYVKDDDKADLDADKMLKTMRETFAAANEERRKRGWPEHKLDGWATAPRYDEKTNNLKWAVRFSSSEDNYQSATVNQNTRLLGRGGIMKVILACDPEDFATSDASADALLASFNYVPGQTYAEYKKGDKIAEYGLAALVVGGAGAIAVKAGLLGFLGKFWKAIAVGIAAIGAGIVKFFNKLTGRQPPPQE